MRAIVLRIDSPGGSATASDAIWRELVITREERHDRPLVVSMSDLAASGGYWIAMAAPYIVAQPGTLTGSIGVVTGKMVTGGTYKKLDANIETVSKGKLAELASPVRPFNDEERKKVQSLIEETYDQFIEKAAAVAAHEAREAGRHRAGPRVDRQAGQGNRAGGRTRRARSRHRGGQAAREDPGRERRGSGRLSAEALVLRIVVEGVQDREAACSQTCCRTTSGARWAWRWPRSGCSGRTRRWRSCRRCSAVT